MLKVKFHTPTQYGSRQFNPGIEYHLEKDELPPRVERYEIIGKVKEDKPVAPKKAKTKDMKPKQVKNTAMQPEEVTTKEDVPEVTTEE